MSQQLFFTSFLNHHLAGAVDKGLALLHVTPSVAQAPISNTVAMELLVFLLLLTYFVAIRLTLSVETPGPVQHIAEMTHEFVTNTGEQIIGHGYERFTNYLTVLLLYILICNLIGLLMPWFESPTENIFAPLGFAIVTFLYYQYHGVRANGFGYIKQFLGPVWWLTPLLFPIEVISHLARMMSLSVRLYANIFAGDLLILASFSLIPVGIPVLFIGLHFAVDIIQAYVFFLLATIYLSMAVSHEH